MYKGKKELFDHLAATHGTAFVNTADPKVERAAKGVGQNVLISSKGWTWTSPEDGPATVGSPSGASFGVHLEGDYNLMNVATAWTVGQQFGMSEAACQRALSAYVPSNHRSQVVRTERNWVLLDAYNANPSSVAHAVASFAAKGHTHPLVVLGDMAELGEASGPGPPRHGERCPGTGVGIVDGGAGIRSGASASLSGPNTLRPTRRVGRPRENTRLKGAKFWSREPAPSSKS